MATPGEEQERNQSAPLLGLNKDPAQGISASQTSRAASHVQKDFYSNKKNSAVWVAQSQSRNMDFPLRCLSTGVAVAGRLRIEGEYSKNLPKATIFIVIRISTPSTVYAPHMFQNTSPAWPHPSHGRRFHWRNQQLRPCRQMAPFPVSLPTFLI